VQHLPIGPILGILPWNAPFWLAFRFAAPALMAGNSCVMKHDPNVPGCAEAIEKCFVEAGAPEGLFQALYVETPRVEAIIRDRRVRGVSFTGSSRGGAAVAGIAGSVIKPAVLELGGSDPSIVLADADFEKATDILTLSRIINAGQSCIAAKRIIVEDSAYETVKELMVKKLGALKVGDPTFETTDVGPIARAELRDGLHAQVTKTIKEGANCLMGGEIPEGDGFFYPVTLLADVKPGMCAFTEETFGPVAVLIRAKDKAHALELANDTDYGLAASVWTDTARGEEMAAKIDAGQVSVNGIVKTDPRLPSGGTKSSGLGRELGPHGILEFVNAQQVWIGPVKT
jgi:succinate-semialdehyde dehydrogenase/glutarate-semialdehyde dehydrogenase